MGCLSGFHAIEERIKSGLPCGPLLVAKPGPRARELVDLALARKIPVDRVGTADLDRLAADHRGIVLEVAEGEAAALTLEGFLAGLGARRDAVVLVLDEITDPHNYGAILRCCDQFAVDLVVSRRRRNAKNAPVLARTSSGASAWVPNAEEPNLVRAMERLKDGGFWIYGAHMEGRSAEDLDLRGRLALVMGGEGGLSKLLREHCDGIVSIPCRGRIDSLNVSVAAGILLYEASRQRRNNAPPRRKAPRPGEDALEVKGPRTAPRADARKV
ncbi:MAG: 23S rRNA (guanosine(2251)-2'-O)-methyltransferase RlmB [Spirochaetaceae bacterium]|jgi:23S rRNA (guanosine2251-2'-O)-methyltransferase|nr:23S rRNA (guanosine(2251)-2'-O)-methyltransferase RlmB [Spirochaetaceae bacterium]